MTTLKQFRLAVFDRLDSGLGIIRIDSHDDVCVVQEFDGDYIGPVRSIRIRYDLRTGMPYIEKECHLHNAKRGLHTRYYLHEFKKVAMA